MNDVLLSTVCQIHRFLLPTKFQKDGNQIITVKEISGVVLGSFYLGNYLARKEHEIWSYKPLQNRRKVINKEEIKSDQ